MTKEENEVIEFLKRHINESPFIFWGNERLKTLLNYIDKLQKENEELRNTKNNCPQFNTSGIKCKNKDIHCPTSKETLDYYENFLIPGYEEEIKKLQKENEELKNKVVKRNNELIELEETSEKEFITKQEVKENFIPKDKIKGKIKEYNKEIKTYEDKMLEITQREKHSAIENKDYIKYSCIISNFTDKIKLLEELLEEE